MKQAFWAVTAGLALSACVATVEPGSVEKGRIAFAQDCAGCHGADAKGGGPLAAGLAVAPPDLTTLSARNGGTFPQVYVMAIIDGLDRGEHFSDAMPEFGAGDLGDPIVVELDEGLGTPVPERLLALAAYLETLQE